ncbi:MAG: hypothetical protein ACREC4_05470, partial [Methylocella sp.]
MAAEEASQGSFAGTAGADPRAQAGGPASRPRLTACPPTIVVRVQVHEPLKPSELVHEPFALLQSVYAPENVAEAAHPPTPPGYSGHRQRSRRSL